MMTNGSWRLRHGGGIGNCVLRRGYWLRLGGRRHRNRAIRGRLRGRSHDALGVNGHAVVGHTSRLPSIHQPSPYPTMMRELNPYDQSAKLGAETLLEILRVTKDVSVLDFMAKELGFTLEPLATEE